LAIGVSFAENASTPSRRSRIEPALRSTSKHSSVTPCLFCVQQNSLPATRHVPRTVFAHVDAGEGAVAAELVSVMHAVGEFMIYEQSAQIRTPNAVPRRFGLDWRDQDQKGRQ
jgi:hypothetical protein